MKKKEKTILQCACCGPEFLVVEDEGDGDYWVQMISGNMSFFRKLKECIKYLFANGNLITGEIVLTKEQISELKSKLLNDTNEDINKT